MTEAKSPKNPNSSRRHNRIAAVQFLYLWSMNPVPDLEDSLYHFLKMKEEPRPYYSFAEGLIQGAIQHQERIDALIQSCTENWAFSRISKIDLALLRLALYELLYRTDIPPIVSINECIELSKVFSTEDSKRFLNGILDKVKGSLSRPFRKADNP